MSKDDLILQNNIVIPSSELRITASRAGGPGGQHVNRTSSKITVHWNVPSTSALSDEQKELVMKNLKSKLSTEGDLIVYNSESRSQLNNKKEELTQALIVPKKRKKKKLPQAVKEARLQEKKRRGDIKKMRSKKIVLD